MVRFKDKSGNIYPEVSERGWAIIRKSGKYIQIKNEGSQTAPAKKKNKDVQLQEEKKDNDKT